MHQHLTEVLYNFVFFEPSKRTITRLARGHVNYYLSEILGRGQDFEEIIP